MLFGVTTRGSPYEPNVNCLAFSVLFRVDRKDKILLQHPYSVPRLLPPEECGRKSVSR